jgi:hypothetical protein
MADWTDRIREAAYTSPSGRRLTFKYEDVSYRRAIKATAYDFTDVDGAYIQTRGFSGRQFPLRCFFSGPNYDKEAAGFEAIVFERGFGTLEHPIYGVHNVAPFGEVARRDDLKTAANQTVLEITFFESIKTLYPSTDLDYGDSVLGAVDAFNEANAIQLERNADLSTFTKRATFKDSILRGVGNVEKGLKALADVTADTQAQFDSVNDSINRGIDVLLRDPLILARQVQTLIQTPARSLASIRSRLSGYAGLLSDIFGRADSISSGPEDNNRFFGRDLFASTLVTGQVLSAVNNQFETRLGAIGAAAEVNAQLDALVTWRDENFDYVGAVDEGESIQALTEAVSLVTGYLIEISFTLKVERSITLDRPRTLVDLLAELYGAEYETQIDPFIKANELTNMEILELPRGRRLAYYL